MELRPEEDAEASFQLSHCTQELHKQALANARQICSGSFQGLPVWQLLPEPMSGFGFGNGAGIGGVALSFLLHQDTSLAHQQ